MKKTITFIITAALMIASFVPAYAIDIRIDDQNVQFTEASGFPFIDQSNRIQVPFRQTMESFGCIVSWDAANQMAIAEKNGITVKVPIGAAYIMKDGQKISIDTAASVKDNRTYLPIRAVLEAFGAVVGWDSSTQTVIAYSTKGQGIMIDGVTYRNGFYGDLWPVNLKYKSDSFEVEGNKFYHVNCDKFDWVLGLTGSTSNGELYCAESQWAQARAYYADNNNFVYYCRIGAQYVDRDPIIANIPNIDPIKFDELMAFADKNSYDPFSSNSSVVTRRLPLPDRDISPELIFYKESKDGYFTSYKGYKFHALDGKLLLVYYYDYGSGKYEEMVAVDIPDEIGQYFINMLAQLQA